MIEAADRAGQNAVHVDMPTAERGPAVPVTPEVADALAAGRPVVALESTIISHGLPRPDNLRVAREIEAAVRAGGAVPATIAMVAGEAVHRAGRRRAGPDRDQHRRGQGQPARSGRGQRARARCGHHGRVNRASGRAGRHRGLRHRRAGRRAPRRPRLLGRVRRPDHAQPHGDPGRLCGGQIHPRRRRDDRAVGDAQRGRARVPDEPVPRVLPGRFRTSVVLARRFAHGGGRVLRRGPPLV